MESALIVSHSEKSVELLTNLLNEAGIRKTAAVSSCGEARRSFIENEYGLVVINSPLKDETGESLSRHIASKGVSQVILVVKSEQYDEISAVCEDDGVLTIAKPINKEIFWSALKFCRSSHKRLMRVQSENAKLKQKIEDIRIVDRAKCVLISYMKMSEQDAHRYIEKQAMDIRGTRRAVAEAILKTYDR